MAVAPYAMVAHTGGTISHGIKYTGFNTIGIPKMIGSLILNTPMGQDSLAMAFWSSLLENRKIAIISPKVIPEPPIWQ